MILRQIISLRLLNSNGRSKCHPRLHMSSWDIGSHVFLEFLPWVNPRTFYKWKSLPAKELLVLNRENLPGRSTTKVSIYIIIWSMFLYIYTHHTHRHITVSVCVLSFSPRWRHSVNFLVPKNIILKYLKISMKCSLFFKLKTPIRDWVPIEKTLLS